MHASLRMNTHGLGNVSQIWVFVLGSACTEHHENKSIFLGLYFLIFYSIDISMAIQYRHSATHIDRRDETKKMPLEVIFRSSFRPKNRP